MFKVAHVEHHLCRKLRSKGMYVDYAGEVDPSVPTVEDVHLWCLETQKCLGPDGRVVAARECAPGRGCYDPAF